MKRKSIHGPSSYSRKALANNRSMPIRFSIWVCRNFKPGKKPKAAERLTKP
jgi:hypothetical protein